ncbi:MAG TPA: hypothetical protein VM901_06565 [Bdellovibrionota bacterium]|jgi:hypothetical protein|nr:hypothetical protein [Bdellovibrionota bacterium]
MKASDLLAIIQHNDPGVLARVQKVKEELKKLESLDKCNACGAHVHFEYQRQAAEQGDVIVIEQGTCQGCLGKVPRRAFALH